MADYIAMDTAAVRHEIDALMAAYPELTADEDLRADMLEGATGLHEMLERLVDREREANAMSAAVKSRADDLAARRKRYDDQRAAMRRLMHGLMEAADQRKITLPEATLSISKARQNVVVDDEGELPQGYVEIVRKPLKAEIGKSLKAGEDVPGARLELGEESLTVRAA